MFSRLSSADCFKGSLPGLRLRQRRACSLHSGRSVSRMGGMYRGHRKIFNWICIQPGAKRKETVSQLTILDHICLILLQILQHDFLVQHGCNLQGSRRRMSVPFCQSLTHLWPCQYSIGRPTVPNRSKSFEGVRPINASFMTYKKYPLLTSVDLRDL